MPRRGPVHLLDYPLDNLKALLFAWLRDLRAQGASYLRPFTHGLYRIDHSVFHAALRRPPLQRQGLVRHLASASARAQHLRCMAGLADSLACPLCGHEKQTVVHILWECPCHALRAARVSVDPALADFNWKHLPTSILLGLPPATTADPLPTLLGLGPDPGVERCEGHAGRPR